MVVALIVLLFLLNFLLTFSVVILYVRQNRLVDVEKSQQSALADSEELISAFLMEIKEENEQFIRKVKELQQSSVHLKDDGNDSFENMVSNYTVDRIVDMRESPITSDIYTHLLEKNETLPLTPDLYPQNLDQLKPVNRSINQIQYEKSLVPNLSILEQVTFWSENGNSIDEIAKKLDKGKTEIELILKFDTRRL